MARLKGEPQIAREVEKEFQAWLSETAQSFKEEKERLEYLMHDAGLEVEHIQYTEPMEVQTQITSPLAGRFFTLIEQLDMIIRYVDCLWVHGEVESKAKTEIMKAWPGKLRKVSNRIRNSALHARKRMRESGQDKEAEQVAQAESGITLSEEEEDASSDSGESLAKEAEAT
ncbi:MAG: hypothetical protein ACLFSI_08990 [Halorhodospira sp.]